MFPNNTLTDYDIVMAFSNSDVLFEGYHPLYRQGEIGIVNALIFVRKSDNPFGPFQSNHTLWSVEYMDGAQLFIPLSKLDRYRVYNAGDPASGLMFPDDGEFQQVLDLSELDAFYETLTEEPHVRGDVLSIAYERRAGKSPRSVFVVGVPDTGITSVPVSKYATFRVWFD